jgi:hypothetical protein
MSDTRKLIDLCKGLLESEFKRVLGESPELGYKLDDTAYENISAVILNNVKPGDANYMEYITDDNKFALFSGGIHGFPYDMWCVLYNIEQVNKPTLCFGCLFKQISKIENVPTYQANVSAKFSDFPRKVASTAYLNLVKNKRCQISCDGKQSDQCAGIWMELLTRPELKDNIFVYDVKNKKRVEALDWKDVWGDTPEHQNILVILKP